MERKKVIVIGGGVSGLTASIYLLDNGFDVDVYEKHTIAGGQCTGWSRKGQYIDGCAHWICGTNPKDELFPLWKHIGAFDENSKIYDTDYLMAYDYKGKMYYLHADLRKLKEELLAISPEDWKPINHLIHHIYLHQHTVLPVKKPVDMMNLFTLTKYGLALWPIAYSYFKYSKISIEEYSKRFKSDVIRYMICNFMNKTSKMSAFFYVLQEASLRNCGVVEGGSILMVNRIVDRFKALGGHLYTGNEVKKIIFEDGMAKGIMLSNGEVKEADYVIAACDIHHIFYNLLENKFTPQLFAERFSNPASHPLNTASLFCFDVKKDISDKPKMLCFETGDLTIFNEKLPSIQMRNYAFDRTLSTNGNTLVSVLVHCSGDVYNALIKLPKDEYKQYKLAEGNKMRVLLRDELGLQDDEIELLDVCTPLTYERYTNAYEGSFMAFISNVKTQGLVIAGILKKLKNFCIASQWLMAPGGLPPALMLGKHAAIRTCHYFRKPFVNKEGQEN